MRRLSTLAALAATTVGVAACGGGGGSGATSKDAAGVRATYKEFITDLRDNRFAQACAVLTPNALKQMKAASHLSNFDCPKIMSQVRKFITDAQIKDALNKTDKLKVTVTGNRATVAPTQAGGQPAQLLYTDGRWKLDQPAG